MFGVNSPHGGWNSDAIATAIEREHRNGLSVGVEVEQIDPHRPGVAVEREAGDVEGRAVLVDHGAVQQVDGVHPPDAGPRTASDLLAEPAQLGDHSLDRGVGGDPQLPIPVAGDDGVKGAVVAEVLAAGMHRAAAPVQDVGCRRHA